VERRIRVSFFYDVGEATRASVIELFETAGMIVDVGSSLDGSRFSLLVFEAASSELLECLRAQASHSKTIAICIGAKRPSRGDVWALPIAGALDVLFWPTLPKNAEQVLSKLERWSAVDDLLASSRVRSSLVGESPTWLGFLRGIVEMATFTQASALVCGETGTGKELIARLIHDLDTRTDKGEFVVVDCTTLVPELSGSELFGHERGAFTGATSGRSGAFASANGGTLFLDEIGELPLPLQAQLLRAIQEHHYKPVGSNTWQRTDFRLICATNRDLEAAVASGTFRADLYYRIAGWLCRTLPLRERAQDILPLARHFVTEVRPGSALDFDEAVAEYLLARDYPGNVRELRRVVDRLCHRHAGPGPITVGDVPEGERPDLPLPDPDTGWADAGFANAIGRALDQNVGLKEIAGLASETAVKLALERENGNLQRAAGRLRVTDRALQMRRANQRLNQ
jgi:transcriptional regulator with GAF, ATPase, and Fis domain